MAMESSASPALPGWLDEGLIAAVPQTLEELEEIVTDIGRSPWLWGHAVSFAPERRTYRLLYKTPQLEIVLFGWAAGQGTTFHDHGGARGAAFICSGLLVEDTIEAADGYVVTQRSHTRHAGTVFSFGHDYIHRVRHDPGQGVALSIHAYTPAVSDSVDYEVLPDGTLRALDVVRELQPSRDRWRMPALAHPLAIGRAEV